MGDERAGNSDQNPLESYVKSTRRSFNDFFSLLMQHGYYYGRRTYSHRRNPFAPGNFVQFFLVFHDGSRLLLDYAFLRWDLPLSESKLFPQVAHHFTQLAERLDLDLNRIVDGIYNDFQMLMKQIWLRLLH